MGEELDQRIREKLNRWVIKKSDIHNLSMRKLGERAGIDQSAISKVLAGKRNAGLEFYLRIARYFNAIPEFLRVAGILPDPGEEGALFADILAAMKELTPEERQEVLRYAVFVKKERSERDTPSIGSEANAHT